MLSSHLISTLFFATITVASPEGSFYASINGTFKPITHMNVSHNDYLLLEKDDSPQISKFTLEKGVFVTGEGKAKKFLSISDEYLILGDSRIQKLHIKMDVNSKIVNLQPHLCRWFDYVKHSAFFMNGDYSSKFKTCSPVEIYFFSPEEVVRLTSGADNKKKGNILRREEDEQMEFSSESDQLSAIELHPRTTIDESMEIENRKAPLDNTTIHTLMLLGILMEL